MVCLRAWSSIIQPGVCGRAQQPDPWRRKEETLVLRDSRRRERDRGHVGPTEESGTRLTWRTASVKEKASVPDRKGTL